MGTRNITNVYVNGEQKLCQYGQWDGYPTGAGRDIMDFIRRTDDARMVERLADVELHVCKDGDLVYVTGYPATDGVTAVMRDKDDFFYRRGGVDYTERKRQAHDYVLGKYGEEAVLRAELSTRDTGCEALDLIYGSNWHVDTWTEPYLMGNDGDWQIEAVWKLYYDTKKLCGIWQGLSMWWSFDEIRSWSEDEMAAALESFERAGYGEDEE